MTEPSLNRHESIVRFENAARGAYGESGWQRKLASDYGFSQSQISKLLNNKVKLTPETEARLALITMKLEQAEGMLKRAIAVNEASVIKEVIADDAEPTTLRGQINERFAMVTGMVRGVVRGTMQFVIVSGEPGLGKSYGALAELRNGETEYAAVTGSVSGPGFFKFVYANRNKVILLDDADKGWNDEDILNMLKAMTNTDETNRFPAWVKTAPGIFNGDDVARHAKISHYEAEIKAELAQGEEEAEEGESKRKTNHRRIDNMQAEIDALREKVPNVFEFTGRVIWITNKNPMEMIENGHRNEEHITALIDRAQLLVLGMDTPEKKMERVAQGIEEFGVLDKKNIDRATDGAMIIEFMRKYADKFQTLSFRTAEKIADHYQTDRNRWKRYVMVTMFR